MSPPNLEPSTSPCDSDSSLPTVAKRTPPVWEKPPSNGRKYLAYKGVWYDVTAFAPRHPGGPIIEEYVGSDATAVVLINHPKEVLESIAKRPICAVQPRKDNSLLRDFEALAEKYEEEGWYDTSYSWYFVKTAVLAAILGAVYMVLDTEAARGGSYVLAAVGGLLLAAFWQQSGFFMHDFMHSQVTHQSRWDYWGGVLFGTVCFGVNGTWWKEEHTIHHSLTNIYDDEYVVDPQASEAIWAQNVKLLPLFSRWQRTMFRLQHLYFLPMLVVAGRVGIMVDSFITERRAHVWAAFIVHWAWVVYLLQMLPTWQTRLLFYTMAAFGQGILHAQLLISHYSKDFVHRKDVPDLNFVQWQVGVNQNISCPPWMDWFHGGLHFHIEHHLLPRMPRNRLRDVSKDLQELCAKHGLEYDSKPFLATVALTVKHLKSVAALAVADPR